MKSINELNRMELQELETLAKDMCQSNCNKCEPILVKCIAFDFAVTAYMQGYRKINKETDNGRNA